MSLDPILHSFAYALDFLREQVAAVSEGDMVAQPKGITNHPAWIIGHLVMTCQNLGGAIGLAPWLPEDWAKRYGTGSVPLADRGAHEPKQRLLALLSDAQQRITDAAEKLDEAALSRPFPDESYRDVFPSIRHALTQVLVGHAAYHVGEVTVWRRAMGLPRLGRSFE